MIASGVFLLMAGLISIAVSRSVIGSTTAKSDVAVTSVLNDALQQVGSNSYQSLLDESFTPPSPCDTTLLNSAGPSCYTVLGREIEVDYEVTVSITGGAGDAAVATLTDERTEYATITASTNFVGRNYSISKQITAPVPSFKDGEAVVRVKLQGDPAIISSLETPVYLLHKISGVYVAVSKTTVSSSGVGLLRVVNPDDCAPSNPCVLGLSNLEHFSSTKTLQVTAAAELADTLAFTADSVTGPAAQILTSANSVTLATPTIIKPSGVDLRILARDSLTGELISPPNNTAGSICLYLNIPLPYGSVSVPSCNFADNVASAADHIFIPGYPVTTGDPSSTIISLPNDRSLTFTSDPVTGFCGAPSQKAFFQASTANTSAWRAAPVCTSYTWGEPFGIANSADLIPGFGQYSGLPFKTASVVLNGGASIYKAVVFDSLLSEPATGASIGSGLGANAWSRPRLAPLCSDTATCLPLGTSLPESIICTGLNLDCLRSGVAPQVSSPAALPNGVYSIAVNSSLTAISDTVLNLSATQSAFATGNSLSVAIIGLSLPVGASLAFNGVAIDSPSLPLTLASNVSTYSSPPLAANPNSLVYSLQPEVTKIGSVKILVTDNAGGVLIFNLALNPVQSTAPWQISTSVVSSYQSQGAATSMLNVIGTDGAALAGETLNLFYAAGMSGPATVVTGPGGNAAVPITWVNSGNTAPAAGYYFVRAVADDSRGGRSSNQSTTYLPLGGTGGVNIAQSAGALSLTVSGGAQSGSGLATASLLDVSSRVWASPDTVVSFASLLGVTGSGGASAHTYPSPSSCIFLSGTCSTPIVIQRKTPAGGYLLTAIANGGGVTASASAAYSVTSSIYSAQSTPSKAVIRQGGSSSVLISFRDGTQSLVSGVAATFSVVGGPGISISSTASEGSDTRVNITSLNTTSSKLKPVLEIRRNGKLLERVPIVVSQVVTNLTMSSTVQVQSGRSSLVAVTAYDAAGDLATGQPLNLLTSGLTAGVSLPRSTTNTNTSGVAVFTISASKTSNLGSSGSLMVQSSFEGQVTASASADITVVPGVYSISVTGAATVGANSPLVLSVTDQAGAVVVGATVRILSVTGTGFTVTSEPATNSSGQAVLTVSTAGDTVAGLYNFAVQVASTIKTLSVVVS